MNLPASHSEWGWVRNKPKKVPLKPRMSMISVFGNDQSAIYKV